MVFQTYALYPHMTAHDNIAFPLKMKKVDRTIMNSKVSDVAEMLGIKHILSRKPAQISGGERQRVALARAIVRAPKVFLMDEPLSNLDARLRIEMRSELKRLHKKLGISTIYVTHDQDEAMSMSDRMAVLHKGAIQQCGTPQELYTNPANVFVAGFIGANPMNLITGVVTDTNPFELKNSDLSLATNIPVPSELLNKLVILGIRPEDIVITDEDSNVTAKPTVIEFTGAGQRVQLEWGKTVLTAVVPVATVIKPDKPVPFKIPPEKCHLFNAQTGERINT
jgi:multiple sugar transport system ATP-binding protein